MMQVVGERRGLGGGSAAGVAVTDGLWNVLARRKR